MASKSFSTTLSGVTLVVDYSTEILKDYPNCVMRWHYQAYLKFTVPGSIYYTGGTFYFHTNKHNIDVNYSTTSGGTTPVFANGYVDLGYGSGTSVTHVPGVSLSLGSVASASGTITATATMPKPTNYHCENPRDITPFSATIDYKLNYNPKSNDHKYWRMYIWDSISGKRWDVSPNTSDGTVTLTGLTPETKYKLTAKVFDRTSKATVALTGNKYAEFTTLVDQLKVGIMQNGQVKKARVFIMKNGVPVKVNKGYVMQNETLKQISNLGGA